MDVFAEFEQLAQIFAEKQVPYALIGGIAMAFHVQPRFTKDIDFLITPDQLPVVSSTLKSLGYLASAEPWKFRNAELVLHRFLKPALDDEFFVDVLIAGSPETALMVNRAQVIESPDHPRIRIARREDMIQLKKLRYSPLDQADIALLQNE